MAEDLKKLYDGVSSQLDIGDYNTFVQKMQTPTDRKKFYDAVSKNGLDLGDYNQYEQRLSSVKKKRQYYACSKRWFTKWFSFSFHFAIKFK